MRIQRNSLGSNFIKPFNDLYLYRDLCEQENKKCLQKHEGV